MIIDANNQILGRMCSKAAKAAMMGETVSVINCEKAVVSGRKMVTKEKYIRASQRGIPTKGPFIDRRPHMLVKRTIRGMIPYKQAKGREALKRVMCYVGVPDEFKGKETVTFSASDVSKLPNLNYITIGEVSKIIGAKI